MQVLTIYTPGITILLLLGLLYIVHRTKVGKAMRAASKDFETTRLMGINLDRIIAITFLLGSKVSFPTDDPTRLGEMEFTRIL